MTRSVPADRGFSAVTSVALLLLASSSICCGPGDSRSTQSLADSSSPKALTVSDADLPVLSGDLSRGPVPRAGLTAHILDDGSVTLTIENEWTGVNSSDRPEYRQLFEDYDSETIQVRVHRSAPYNAVSAFIEECSDPSVGIWSFYFCGRRKETGDAAWVVVNVIFEETVLPVAVHLSPDSQSRDFRVNELSGLNREEALTELYQFLQPPRNKGEQVVMRSTGDPTWSAPFGFAVEILTMRPDRGQGLVEGVGWVGGLLLETPVWH